MSGNVALAGMMGVGKTTIGRALAGRLGRRLVDTDEEIVTWTGQDIPAIFAERGETGFRVLEREVVRRLSELDDLVIALGGGVVLSDDNVADLTLTGVIVGLTAPLDVLVERLEGFADRPLLDGDLPGRLEQLLGERADVYAAASDVTIDAARSPDDVVEDILVWLRERPTVLTPSEFEAILP
ncbi:MAG: shikimate kinase [Nitriliruptorales bacterium]|nr:shikimate kinase [Nitriliruptorales bacterium]